MREIDIFQIIRKKISFKSEHSFTFHIKPCWYIESINEGEFMQEPVREFIVFVYILS